MSIRKRLEALEQTKATVATNRSGSVERLGRFLDTISARVGEGDCQRFDIASPAELAASLLNGRSSADITERGAHLALQTGPVGKLFTVLMERRDAT